MGGIFSGQGASHKPSLENLYSIDVCKLYRCGALQTGTKMKYRYSDGYFLKMECKEKFWGWDHCLHIRYPVVGEDNRVKMKEQVIGFEMVDVLNGKAKRPYFFCPQLECHASKLYLGDTGFGHRSYHGYLYESQRQGHFDRAIRTCNNIKKKLSCLEGHSASEKPIRPKGMHRKTYAKYVKKHNSASRSIFYRLGPLADY